LGIAIPFKVELTREQFEAITPLVERSIRFAMALHIRNIPDMVDVVLVGGSSHLTTQVRQAFGADKVVVHPRPMHGWQREQRLWQQG